MLLAAPRRGERTRAGTFHGSADALAIAELAGKVRPLLAITATAAEAQRLLAEIPFFAPELKVCQFPDWSTPLQTRPKRGNEEVSCATEVSTSCPTC